MKPYKYIALAALAFGFAACTQDDDFSSHKDEVVKIASAEIATEIKTRANTDEDGASWDATESILLVNESRQTKNVGTYNLADGKWSPGDGLVIYATGKNKFTAYYPAKNDIDYVFPANQSDISDLKYADRMKATAEDVEKGGEVVLSFNRQHAKVTITTEFASQYAEGTAIDGMTISETIDGNNITITPHQKDGSYIAILKPKDDGFSVTVNIGNTELKAQTNTAIVAGKHYIFKLKVGKDKVTFGDVKVNNWNDQPISGNVEEVQPTELDLTTEARTINDDGYYIIKDQTAENSLTINGNATVKLVNSTINASVNVTGGSPKIYLNNATIQVDAANSINITGGTPTVYVQGTNNVECTDKNHTVKAGAGIYVAKECTVKIIGNSHSDVLTAKAINDGAGIGGYYDNLSCGKIYISNVTVYAYSDLFFGYSPGIGACSRLTTTNPGHGTCDGIYISDATVYAYGQGSDNMGCSAIGSFVAVPDIVISNSEIHAYRGAGDYLSNYSSWGDWIGRGGSEKIYQDGEFYVDDYQGGAIQGTITNSTIYKYKVNSQQQKTSEGAVEYDDKGVGTEKE